MEAMLFEVETATKPLSNGSTIVTLLRIGINTILHEYSYIYTKSICDLVFRSLYVVYMYVLNVIESNCKSHIHAIFIAIAF